MGIIIAILFIVGAYYLGEHNGFCEAHVRALQSGTWVEFKKDYLFTNSEGSTLLKQGTLAIVKSGGSGLPSIWVAWPLDGLKQRDYHPIRDIKNLKILGAHHIDKRVLEEAKRSLTEYENRF